MMLRKVVVEAVSVSEAVSVYETVLYFVFNAVAAMFCDNEAECVTASYSLTACEMAVLGQH